MEAKHTPGPWFVSSAGRNKVASVTSTTGIYSDAWPDGESITADARLIAAAPELLEALHLAVNQLKGLTFTDSRINAALEKSMRAIAKATQ